MSAVRAISAGVAFAVGLSALIIASPAAADDQQQFDYAKRRYQDDELLEAEDRFADMLNPSHPPCADAGKPDPEKCRVTSQLYRDDARAYYAATLFLNQKPEEARKQIEILLRSNIRYQPSADIPTAVYDMFIEIQGPLEQEMMASAAANAQKKIEEERKQQAALRAYLSYVDRVTELAQSHEVKDENSRIIATIPFGVGQFQNGDNVLGVVFGLAELAAGTTSIVTMIVHDQLVADGTAAGGDLDVPPVNADLSALEFANRFSYALWAATTLIGIGEAHYSFEEGETRRVKHKLPPKPPLPAGLTPSVDVRGEGAVFGVSGRF